MTPYFFKMTAKTLQVSAFILISSLSLIACNQTPKYEYIDGETMGTSYHIRYQPAKGVDDESLQAAVDKRLAVINDSMSTYQDDSTITKFNQLSMNSPLTIEDDFIKVLKDAQQVHKLSDGAFDPTVMPLINLWGFGRVMTVDRLQNPPSLTDINAAKTLIDFNSIQLDDNQLRKTKDGVELDFSAIAKGYGVDVIASVLEDQYKVTNYMVEIGGEVATHGMNPSQQPWQIAIDAPVQNSQVERRETIALIHAPNDVNQMHIATSGNYRNSLVFDGKRYSHTIDPTTGHPIVDGAPSVTVAANSVSLADAWATALTAMPYEKAKTVAMDNNIAALFVIPASGNISEEVAEASSLNTEASAPTLWKLVETPAMEVFNVTHTP